MFVFSLLKTIYQRTAKETSLPPVAPQKEFLDAVSEPKDDWERSYFQYRCQMFLAGRVRRFIYNASAAVLLCFPKKTHLYEDNLAADAVYAFIAGLDVLPDSLRQEFPQLVHRQDYLQYYLLTKEDRRYLRQLGHRYPFAFYFRYKCKLKIGMYRALIEAFHPKALIVSAEYSFTSSLLTDYCHQHNIEHIDVMHGEKLFYIQDSFFRFNRCYVWDAHYINLFRLLKAEQKQFVVECPPAMQPWPQTLVEKQLDYIYYLGAESEATLQKIAGKLNDLQSQGKHVAVRPHPRYSDYELVRKYFGGIKIEYPDEKSIKESILQTKYVIALNSTVLNQAYVNGTRIVIDDISDRKSFTNLKDAEYIMLQKPHVLLSEIV